MIIGDTNKYYYINSANAVYDIDNLPDDYSKLVIGKYYIIGDMVYIYSGEVDKPSDLVPGSIGTHYDKFYVNTLSEEDDIYEERTMSSIVPKEEYETMMHNASAIVNRYILKFKQGVNLAKGLESKMKNTGEVYVPVIKDTDDVLTRMMKLMIIDKKVILSQYKDKTEKDYNVDNLRSALNGTTLNMTISKFLDWCKLLGLEWKFEIFDDPLLIEPHPYPLGERVTIAHNQDLHVEMGPSEPGIFRVEINKNDDPLKKLVKYAVWKKRMILSEYKDKGSTPHLLNNMRSALKRNSKMMINYFCFWCEILGITYNFELYDPATGITHCGNRFYKATDYVDK